VANPEEMVAKAIELLKDEGTGYFPVVPHRIQDTAVKIMRLFGYEPSSGVA
jgi:hypothetical protein